MSIYTWRYIRYFRECPWSYWIGTLWKLPWNFLWKFPGNFPGSFTLNLTTWKLPIEEIVNYQISLKNNTQFLHIPVFKTQFLNLLVFLKLSETLWNLVKLCETLSWNFLWKLHAISKSWKLSIYNRYPEANVNRGQENGGEERAWFSSSRENFQGC